MVPVLAVALYFGLGTYLWGPWVEAATASNTLGVWTGPDGAKLVVKPHGFFTLNKLSSSLKTEVQILPVASWRSCDRGTWEITPADELDPGEPPQLDLRFQYGCDDGQLGLQIELERLSPMAMALDYYIGDPDDDDLYQFVKPTDSHS